jgi:hypothetical protein
VNQARRRWALFFSYPIPLIAGVVVTAGLLNSRVWNPEAALARESRSMATEQGYVNIRSLQMINSLPDTKIANLGDAQVYVNQVAAACGVQGPVLTGELLPRLAQGELAAGQDPSHLVSDDRVAEAFNFLSREFQVPHPAPITGTDVLQFRTTMSAIYPHVFSPNVMSGSRPVQALITLHQLVFNGGVPEGAKKFARKDPVPGSFKVVSSRVVLAPGGIPSAAEMEYRTASRAYLRGLTAQAMQSFVDSLTKIMALPAGR